jgi:hypothetical protein
VRKTEDTTVTWVTLGGSRSFTINPRPNPTKKPQNNHNHDNHNHDNHNQDNLNQDNLNQDNLHQDNHHNQDSHNKDNHNQDEQKPKKSEPRRTEVKPDIKEAQDKPNNGHHGSRLGFLGFLGLLIPTPSIPKISEWLKPRTDILRKVTQPVFDMAEKGAQRLRWGLESTVEAVKGLNPAGLTPPIPKPFVNPAPLIEIPKVTVKWGQGIRTSWYTNWVPPLEPIPEIPIPAELANRVFDWLSKVDVPTPEDLVDELHNYLNKDEPAPKDLGKQSQKQRPQRKPVQVDGAEVEPQLRKPRGAQNTIVRMKMKVEKCGLLCCDCRRSKVSKTKSGNQAKPQSKPESKPKPKPKPKPEPKPMWEQLVEEVEADWGTDDGAYGAVVSPPVTAPLQPKLAQLQKKFEQKYPQSDHDKVAELWAQIGQAFEAMQQAQQQQQQQPQNGHEGTTPPPEHPRDVLAQLMFDHSFPNGHELIDTPGSNLECGLYAIRLSMGAQYPQIPQPKLEDLRAILRSPEVEAYWESFQDLDTDPGSALGDNNLTADQVQALLSWWAEAFLGGTEFQGIELKLGVYLQGHGPQLMYSDGVREGDNILWVHNNAASSVNGGIFDHYSGLRPRPAHSNQKRNTPSPTKSMEELNIDGSDWLIEDQARWILMQKDKSMLHNLFNFQLDRRDHTQPPHSKDRMFEGKPIPNDWLIDELPDITLDVEVPTSGWSDHIWNGASSPSSSDVGKDMQKQLREGVEKLLDRWATKSWTDLSKLYKVASLLEHDFAMAGFLPTNTTDPTKLTVQTVDLTETTVTLEQLMAAALPVNKPTGPPPLRFHITHLLHDIFPDCWDEHGEDRPIEEVGLGPSYGPRFVMATVKVQAALRKMVFHSAFESTGMNRLTTVFGWLKDTRSKDTANSLDAMARAGLDQAVFPILPKEWTAEEKLQQIDNFVIDLGIGGYDVPPRHKAKTCCIEYHFGKSCGVGWCSNRDWESIEQKPYIPTPSPTQPSPRPSAKPPVRWCALFLVCTD